MSFPIRSLPVLLASIVGCEREKTSDTSAEGTEQTLDPLRMAADNQCVCKGERGPAGLQGPRGPQGIRGPQGRPGRDGADGTSCFGESVPEGVRITCGEDTYLVRHGERGEQGPAGHQGLPGADGASCLGQSVAEGVQITCGQDTYVVRNGERGPVGPQGSRGEQGPIGPAGNGLHLWDANGQDLGIALSESTVYRNDLDFVIQFAFPQNSPNAKVATRTDFDIWFDGPDCTGNVYLIDERVGQHIVLFRQLFSINCEGSNSYKLTSDIRPAETTVVSRFPWRQRNEDVCQELYCSNEEPLLTSAYLLEQIEFPFEEPIVGPLRMGLAR